MAHDIANIVDNLLGLKSGLDLSTVNGLTESYKEVAPQIKISKIGKPGYERVTHELDGSAALHVEAAKNHHDLIAAQEKNGPLDAVEKKAAEITKFENGANAHSELDALSANIKKTRDELNNVQKELFSRAAKDPKLAATDAYKNALKHVEEQKAEFNKFAAESEKLVAKARGEVLAHTGLAAKAGGAAAEHGAGNIATRTFKAFGAAPTANKVGAAVGTIIVLDGLRNAAQIAGITPKKVDDQGKEVPTDTGQLVRTAAELGGGALLVAQVLKGHMPAKSMGL